jgi:Tfp pilus assembly protein PilF
MIKRTLALSLFAVIIPIGLIQQRSATAGAFDWPALAAMETTAAEEACAENDADDTTSNATGAPKKKSGNSFARALGSPFRAIGRLFTGGSKKKDQQQSRRVSKQDAKKFESLKISRVKDARSDTPSAPASAVPQVALNTNLQRGQELLMSGDLNGAIAELSIAASSDKQSGEARNLLGVAYENKGLRQRALESFKAAVNIDKDNAQYLNNYGFLLYKNGDMQEATKQLKRAVKHSPKDALIWNNLGLAQSQHGKFDDAYKSFVQAGGEYAARMNISAQLLARGYAKDAIVHLEKAQAIDPNSADVLHTLANLYQMTGRHSDAETARRSLVALKTSAEANK